MVTTKGQLRSIKRISKQKNKLHTFSLLSTCSHQIFSAVISIWWWKNSIIRPFIIDLKLKTAICTVVHTTQLFTSHTVWSVTLHTYTGTEKWRLGARMKRKKIVRTANQEMSLNVSKPSAYLNRLNTYQSISNQHSNEVYRAACIASVFTPFFFKLRTNRRNTEHLEKI